MDPEAAREYAELRSTIAMERADRADERMKKFDKQLQATRRLGMKYVVRIDKKLDGLNWKVDSLMRIWGNGHHRPRATGR